LLKLINYYFKLKQYQTIYLAVIMTVTEFYKLISNGNYNWMDNYN